MGKRRKRLTMARYAKKYATKRAALGFDTRKVESKLVEIDMVTGEEIKEDDTVQVITNSTPKEPERETIPPWNPEPELQTIQIEEPKVEVPPPVEAKKPTRKRTNEKNNCKKDHNHKKNRDKEDRRVTRVEVPKCFVKFETIY